MSPTARGNTWTAATDWASTACRLFLLRRLLGRSQPTRRYTPSRWTEATRRGRLPGVATTCPVSHNSVPNPGLIRRVRSIRCCVEIRTAIRRNASDGDRFSTRITSWDGQNRCASIVGVPTRTCARGFGIPRRPLAYRSHQRSRALRLPPDRATDCNGAPVWSRLWPLMALMATALSKAAPHIDRIMFLRARPRSFRRGSISLWEGNQ
jgi:hypothetical protein